MADIPEPAFIAVIPLPTPESLPPSRIVPEMHLHKGIGVMGKTEETGCFIVVADSVEVLEAIWKRLFPTLPLDRAKCRPAIVSKPG